MIREDGQMELGAQDADPVDDNPGGKALLWLDRPTAPAAVPEVKPKKRKRGRASHRVQGHGRVSVLLQGALVLDLLRWL